MDIKLSEEQEMLRKSAGRFLEKNCPSSLVREMVEDEKGYTDALWQGMAELGWTGLIIPEAYGGVGMGFLDGRDGPGDAAGSLFLNSCSRRPRLSASGV